MCLFFDMFQNLAVNALRVIIFFDNQNIYVLN